MNKKFLAKVLLASVLVSGVNLFPMANIEVDNVQISVAYAESKNFAAKDAAMTDVEYIETQAKEASRLRAIEAVKEKIAAYVRNFSGAKGKLNEDDIAAIAEKFEEVGTAQYKKLFYNAVDEDGQELGKVGIMYEATVTAKFNSKKITEYIKLSEQEKARRIRQAREAREKFEELDREYEELRKNARTKTPEQLQSEIKNFDDKLSDLEKSKKNKAVKKSKETKQQDKIQPMKFANSIELGEFGWTDYGGFGVSIKKANSVTEKPKVDSGVSVYSKGVARFGKGEDSIYLHYDKGGFKNGDTVVGFKLGGEDVASAVAYDYFWTTISKVGVNNGYKMYLLKKSGNALRTIQYVLIGRRPDGKWVKYFDTEEMCKQYLGNSQNVSILQVTMNGDKIIAHYVRNQGSNANEAGEFRFKWDEVAKWFGVEKITYNQTSQEQKPVQENKPVTNQPMHFSQPIKLGRIIYQEGSFDIVIENATYTSNPPTKKIEYPADNLIRFNNGENSLYVHHKSRVGYQQFGDKDINNTIQIGGNEVAFNIFQLKNNSSIKFYLICEQGIVANSNNWTCIAKKEGKWIKYFDTNAMKKQYFGDESVWGQYMFSDGISYEMSGGNSVYDRTYCKNDTIIIEYTKRDRSRTPPRGAFKFKWDEKAQWFSVEQVKY